jgi:hypothetical protein
MKKHPDFCKFFFDHDLGQIVMMRKQNDEGEPEVRFWFQQEGAVSSFSIGWDKDPDKRSKQAFSMINQREVVEICSGWIASVAPADKH